MKVAFIFKHFPNNNDNVDFEKLYKAINSMALNRYFSLIMIQVDNIRQIWAS